MAVTVSTDLAAYQNEIHTGMTEVEAQNAMAFGAQSNGTIQLFTEHHRGDYDKSGRFDTISNLVSRRVTTSTSAATSLKMTEDENIAVKVSRKIGPVDMTRDSIRYMMDNAPSEANQMRLFMRAIGRQAEKAAMLNMLNTGLIAAEAALDAVAAVNHDGTAATLKHAALVSGLALFGDRAQDISAWVMHSAPYYDLLGNAIGTNGFDGVATRVINTGEVGLIRRPAVLTDSSALTTGAGSTLQYQVLGLVPGAIEIQRNYEPEIFVETVSGNENLIWRLQGEFDFTVRLKGFKWKTASGANPDDSTIGTGSNWTKIATDDKDIAGVHVNVSG